jgi:hypothetical protein
VRLRRRPSELLIPLAFAAHAGSLLVLTGSPVNVVIAEAADDAGVGRITYFEFALVGLPLLAGTVAIVVLLSGRLLPERTPRSMPSDFSAHAQTLVHQYGLDTAEELLTRTSGVAEVVIPPRSELVGQVAYPGMVTESGDLVVLAVQRREEALPGESVLAVGDTLLLQGSWGSLGYHLDDPDVRVVDAPEQVRRQTVSLGPGAKRALVVLAGMVALLATGAVPPAVTGLLAACAIVLSGVLSIEQAYLTTTSLPNQLQARLGRFLMPVGKQNGTHRHDLHTIEYPHVIQRFLGPEGLKGTGLQANRVFSPFGFYQELIVAVVDRVGERGEGLTATEPPNRSLGGLGYSARLRNYVDLTEAANVELSVSAMTGRREQPLAESYAVLFGDGTTAALARQSVVGADFTYRWRPLQEGLYRSLILQGEVMRQINGGDPSIPIPTGCTTCGALETSYAGPLRDFTGAYVFARYQTSRRAFVGARGDWLQDEQNEGRTLRAGSVYLEWFPSEFSKLVAGYEAMSPAGGTVTNRLLLQAAFSLGPHKPHPF